MANILLIDDCEDDLMLTKRAIGPNNFYTTAFTFRSGLRKIEDKDYDILLADLWLPDGCGHDLCEHSRRYGNREAPVLLLTASDTCETRIAGFSSGIDGFIAKPFDPPELKVRVESQLKKSQQKKLNADFFMIGDLEIDRRLQKVCFVTDGQYKDLSFTPIEFRLLLCLCQDVGRVYSRAELMEKAWGENIHVCFRSVDTHISHIREKLCGKSSYIESVASCGYRLRKEEIMSQAAVAFEETGLLHDILDFDTCWKNSLFHYFI